MYASFVNVEKKKLARQQQGKKKLWNCM